MSDAFWQRYLEVGEELATQSELFPGVVAFLEAIADDDGSRAFILRFHESQLADLSPGASPISCAEPNPDSPSWRALWSLPSSACRPVSASRPHCGHCLPYVAMT